MPISISLVSRVSFLSPGSTGSVGYIEIFSKTQFRELVDRSWYSIILVFPQNISFCGRPET